MSRCAFEHCLYDDAHATYLEFCHLMQCTDVQIMVPSVLKMFSLVIKQISSFTLKVENNLISCYGLKILAYSLVSFAAGDADEFFYATSIPQGFGVLHVLGDDFVQCAADGSNRIV